ARAAIWTGARTEPDDLDKLLRGLGDYPAIRPEPEYRCGRAGSAGGHQCGINISADQSAEPSDLQQGESSGCAGPDAGADVRYFAAANRGRSGRHEPGTKNFAASRRGAGDDQRRAEARGARAGEPNGAGFVWSEPGGSAGGAGPGECGPGEGKSGWDAAIVHDRSERSASFKLAIRLGGDFVPQWRARARLGRSAGGGWR